jgi:hypothetical protein
MRELVNFGRTTKKERSINKVEVDIKNEFVGWL